MLLPDGLISAFRQGNVVLFLGVGTSAGSQTPSGQEAPIGSALATSIAHQSLDSRFKTCDVQAVSKIASATAGRSAAPSGATDAGGAR